MPAGWNIDDLHRTFHIWGRIKGQLDAVQVAVENRDTGGQACRPVFDNGNLERVRQLAFAMP
ncbi:hypothetical protein D3C83_58420 [compost metagenome]